jgi:aminomethyltransferase
MPLFFTGIIQESLAVRNSVGIFDVSHMGRFEVSGSKASKLLNKLLTIDVEKGDTGKAMYGFFCNERGGVIDDLITYKRGEDDFVLVVNCANRQKDFEWLLYWSKGMDVKLIDKTDSSVLIAVQGPLSSSVVTDLDSKNLKRFRFVEGQIGMNRCLISRTGYTGEDGFEIMLDGITFQNSSPGLELWKRLSAGVLDAGGVEAGLGARDTLRLEAGLPLHGSDLSEDISPIEACLSRFVDMEKTDYIGKQAHIEQSSDPKRKLVGLVCEERVIPRSHYDVLLDGRKVGYITSGTFSPIVGKGIGLALVQSDAVVDKRQMEVDVRGRRCKAEISQLPFYDVSKYGFKRNKN